MSQRSSYELMGIASRFAFHDNNNPIHPPNQTNEKISVSTSSHREEIDLNLLQPETATHASSFSSFCKGKSSMNGTEEPEDAVCKASQKILNHLEGKSSCKFFSELDVGSTSTNKVELSGVSKVEEKEKENEEFRRIENPQNSEMNTVQTGLDKSSTFNKVKDASEDDTGTPSNLNDNETQRELFSSNKKRSFMNEKQELIGRTSKKTKTVNSHIDLIIDLIKKLNKKEENKMNESNIVVATNVNDNDDGRILELILEVVSAQQSNLQQLPPKLHHNTLTLSAKKLMRLLTPPLFHRNRKNKQSINNRSDGAVLKLLDKDFVPRLNDVIVSENEEFLQQYGNRACNDMFERILQDIAVPAYIEIIRNQLYNQQKDIIKAVIETIHYCGGSYIRPVILPIPTTEPNSDMVEWEIVAKLSSVCHNVHEGNDESNKRYFPLNYELRWIEVSSAIAQLYTFHHIRKQAHVLGDDDVHAENNVTVQKDHSCSQ